MSKKRNILILSALLSSSCMIGCERKEEVVEKISEEDIEKQKEIERQKKIDEALALYEEDVKPLYIDGILVANKEYKVPKNFATELTEEVKEQFKLMQEAAKKDGLYINIRSGFRSNDTQRMLYNNYVAKDGVEKASRYSAKPGHSEHETGLAIDISNGSSRSIGDWFTETPQAKWLYENAYKYGFILRYPEGKEDITGYKYESWHYRYVGTEHSQYFNQNNLTLEEYLGLK